LVAVSVALAASTAEAITDVRLPKSVNEPLVTAAVTLFTPEVNSDSSDAYEAIASESSLVTAIPNRVRIFSIFFTKAIAPSDVTARLFLPLAVANSAVKLFSAVCADPIFVVPSSNVVRRVSSFAISLFNCSTLLENEEEEVTLS